MRKIGLLIGILFLGGCSKTPDDITISLYSIGFEMYKSEIIEEEMKFWPSDIYFKFTVQNNTDDVLYFGSQYHQFETENLDYGYFYLLFNGQIIEIYAGYTTYYPIPPGGEMDFDLSHYGKFAEIFDISSKGVNNNEKLLQIFNNWEIFYEPIPGGYEKGPFPTEKIKVNTDNFFIFYGSGDGKFGMTLFYDKNKIKGTDDYLINLGLLTEEEKEKIFSRYN